MSASSQESPPMASNYSCELAAFSVNGEQPPYRAGQAAILVIKQERSLAEGTLWYNNEPDRYQLHNVLQLELGFEQLVRMLANYSQSKRSPP
jgi:hypothetical protein